jgi:hypothetical protein
MGLFEEIERAWFTVDNKLFLWDYSDGCVASLFGPFSGRAQTLTPSQT